MTKPLTPTPQTEVERLRTLSAQLLDNPIWHEALDKIEAEYVRLFRESKPIAALEREHAYQMIQAVTGLRNELQSFATVGRLSPENAQKNVKR